GYHPRQLRLSQGERHNANERAVFSRCNDRQPPPFSQMSPPGKEPLVAEKQAVRCTRTKQGVPFFTYLLETLYGFDLLDLHAGNPNRCLRIWSAIYVTPSVDTS